MVDKSFLGKMVDPESDVSSMRVIVFLCAIVALLIALLVSTMWAISVIRTPETPTNVASMIGLIGTLLSVLIPKAIQSFSKDDKPNRGEWYVE